MSVPGPLEGAGSPSFGVQFKKALKFVGETLAVHTVFGLGLGVLTFLACFMTGIIIPGKLGWSNEFTILTLSIPWVAVCRLFVSIFDWWTDSIRGVEWELGRYARMRKSGLITSAQEASLKAKLLDWYGSKPRGPMPPRT